MEPVDLLVFGPHPDDLEIGLGGTIALHAALGYRVGLCDLTAGEMGSNLLYSELSSRPKLRVRCSGPRGGSTCAGPTAALVAIRITFAAPCKPSAKPDRGRSPCRTGRIVIRIMLPPSRY